MTAPQKLIQLRQISGLSQTELAKKLGVSFVSFNTWIHGKSVPRKKAQARIDALYAEYTGLTVIPQSALDAKKKMLLTKAKQTKNVLETILKYPDIRDQFVLLLTYTSNAIEGSTLTEAETAAVLFQHRALPDKTFIEQLEAKNHQTALLHLFDHLSSKKPIDEHLLLRLHAMLMNGIRSDAGSYRHHGVRIVGADVPTANYAKVPFLMEELAEDLAKPSKDILAQATTVHARFEQIHPFSDGNGRIGRLLLHAMFLKKNLPPAVITPERKYLYYSSLNTAQKSADNSLLQDFLCDAVLEGWRILEREM